VDNPGPRQELPKADVFTAALIKGVIEGDIYAHLGSLGGFPIHLATARALELIDLDDEHIPTSRARALYEHHRLDQLPAGRAYLVWHGSLIVEAVLAELNGEVEKANIPPHD